MSTQSESKLEADLIQQLIDKNYDSVRIDDETELKANLQTQLEALNNLSFTEKSLAEYLIILIKETSLIGLKSLEIRCNLPKMMAHLFI